MSQQAHCKPTQTARSDHERMTHSRNSFEAHRHAMSQSRDGLFLFGRLLLVQCYGGNCTLSALLPFVPGRNEQGCAPSRTVAVA